MQALALTTSEPSATAVASMNPREAAQRALKTGDMKGLAKLADTLMAAVAPAKRGRPRVGDCRADPASEQAFADLLTSYADDTLKGARRLGLAARRLESRVELASLRQYAWNPLFSDESGRLKVKQVPLPAGTPEAFRERLEMLMIHPLVNSGGARHLPRLVAEDVLVEDFPDPKEGDEAPASELLARLGLPGRRTLPRIAIEQALLTHGADVLEKELGSIPGSSDSSASLRTSIFGSARRRTGVASPSGPTSTDISSWPMAGCARSPGETCGTAACTTSSASAGTTTPTA